VYRLPSRLVLTTRLVVTVAEIGGHDRIETMRIYTQPTDEDKLAALDHLTVDW
jgi:hypothetical protein